MTKKIKKQCIKLLEIGILCLLVLLLSMSLSVLCGQPSIRTQLPMLSQAFNRIANAANVADISQGDIRIKFDGTVSREGQTDLNWTKNEPFEIQGSTNTHRIIVEDGVRDAILYLNGVTISLSSENKNSCITLEGDAQALIRMTKVQLGKSDEGAGIEVSGKGELTVEQYKGYSKDLIIKNNGIGYGAGIGNRWSGSQGGTIRISGLQYGSSNFIENYVSEGAGIGTAY
ncbi:MAG: hypothetical protein RR614_10290, partial [Eubacterium sp.]